MKMKRTYTGITPVLGLMLLTINAWAAPYISFGSNRTENYDIYVIDTDRENLRNLTNHPAYDYGADVGTGRTFFRFYVKPRWRLRYLYHETQWNRTPTINKPS